VALPSFDIANVAKIYYFNAAYKVTVMTKSPKHWSGFEDKKPKILARELFALLSSPSSREVSLLALVSLLSCFPQPLGFVVVGVVV